MPRSAGLFDSPDALALDWSGLYDEHAPRLHRIVARRVGAEHANDVVQDIFVRAYRNRHAVDRSRPVGAWLSTIALRASTDALRRRSVRSEVLVDDNDAVAFLGGDVDEEFENRVRREGIRAAFDSLSERQQRVFVHLAIDGWSQEQVAADEGISTDAVKSLFARARRTFKETYEAFAERMGVFGGGVVGTAVWRLRTRLQRLHGLVGEHAGAITAAAATVTVVAIATVPTTRAVPSRAAEPAEPAAATETTATSQMHAQHPTSSPVAVPAVPTSVTLPNHAYGTPPTPPPSSGQAGQQPHDSIATEARVHSDGTRGQATIETTLEADGRDAEVYGGVVIHDCDSTQTWTAACVAATTASGVAPRA